MKESALPPMLVELLNGRDLSDKQQEAFQILTISSDEWPHTSMVSVGEVVALDHERLRISLWPGTRTTNNILRTGKAKLVISKDGIVYYVRMMLAQLPELQGVRYRRERFEARVVAVRADKASYAEVVSGFKIKLHEPGDVVERWTETVNDLLK